MAGKRLYKTDAYRLSNVGKVIAVSERNGFDCITCDASVFFPTGGGQPCDIGTVRLDDRLFGVTDVFDENLESDVWHMTDAPAGTFSVGDEVELTIDWDRRLSNMQRHCGEHMLSGTMHTLFGGVNRGFHMGEEYITIDIDLDGRMLTDEEIDLAERTVNTAIWADLPVTVTYFENYEKSLAMPVRKQVPHDGEVSVVTVGDVDNPYDCIACCGIHPSGSAQVGLLSIYKHEPNKGMNRIYFDCGTRALQKLNADRRLLTVIANGRSCSTSDIARKLDIERAEISELKGRVIAMSAYIKEAEKTKILEGMNAGGNAAYTYSTDLIGTDELLKLGFAVIGETQNRLLMLMHESSGTILMFSSGEAKCGALIKEYAPQFNGRGGGRDDNARAVFTDNKDMRAFADRITQVL